MIYERATGVPDPKRCQPGTKALYETVLFFGAGKLAFNGCYVRRFARGSKTAWSCHAEGRAFDLNAALPSGKPNPVPVPQGSPADQIIRYWIAVLIWNHVALGVQRIVYKQTEWVVGKGERTLSPVSSLAKMHANHMHVEMIRDKAKNLTPVDIRRTLFGK